MSHEKDKQSSGGEKPVVIRSGKIIDKKKELQKEDKGVGDSLKNNESRVSNKTLIITVLLVLLVGFGSAVGVHYYNQYKINKFLEDHKYNGFQFKPTSDGFWSTDITVNGQLYNIPFYYYPGDLEDIYVQKGVTYLLTNPYHRPEAVYISVDPDANSRVVVGGVEISRITGYKYNMLNIYTTGAVHYNPTNDTDLLVVNCSVASPDRIVLYYEKGPNNAIFASPDNPYCIILQYVDNESAIKVSDRFAYELLTIMPKKDINLEPLENALNESKKGVATQ